MADAKAVSVTIREYEEQVSDAEQNVASLMQFVPNRVHDSVTDEDTIVAEWGEVPKFDFAPKAHWDLCETLDILDFKAAVKLSGSRFVLYKGAGARLERALINYCLDTHTRLHGYTEISPPFLCLEECFFATGSLPKQADEMYRFKEDPYYLIPTAEVPLVNIHRGEILNESDLPKCYAAYTPCFRREAGSYGKDVRGMIRVHQFDKVELVKFVRPENSMDELKGLLSDAEDVLRALELPYRVIEMCTGDLSFSAMVKFDLELWAPGCGEWLEVSSCSNFGDFQARRAAIRVKVEGAGGKPRNELVHTLNGSGLPVGRTLVAILENFQRKDGSVAIPKVLRSYCGGLMEIRKH
jgi:seryl-tRNA synthetase